MLVGIYRKPTALLAFVAMLFYAPFSLYLVLENPVSDCGCFGSALQLTNEETFVKNIFLLLMAGVTCFNTALYRRCISSHTRWLAVLFVVFYILLVESISLWFLPVIDFRPFAVGTNLRKAVVDVPAQYEVKTIYEKGGEQRTFPSDVNPGEGWSYIGSSNRLVAAARPALVDNFSIIDVATDNDVADKILADTGYVALLVVEMVERADESRVDKINDIYDYCKEQGIGFYAATSSSDEAVALWCKRTGAEYKMYWADNDMLKTMVRANPGLLLLKNGVIVKKWNINYVPEVDSTAPSTSLLRKKDISAYVAYMSGWLFWLLMFALPMAVILFIDMFSSAGKSIERSGSDNEPLSLEKKGNE